MFEKKNPMFEKFTFNTPVSEKEIIEVEKELNVKFPRDYLDFMQKTNGGEGTIGEVSYLRIWKIEELAESNEDYEVSEYAPGFVVIGSDGGGTVYGYDFRNDIPKLVEVSFIGLNIDTPNYSTNNFFDFIDYLYND
ncbi:SMI1/KNR4 family protein [Mesobacillus subterraneus]|nr:SMI1/KNR4 family protein [Mesobacillus subterraneus]